MRIGKLPIASDDDGGGDEDDDDDDRSRLSGWKPV